MTTQLDVMPTSQLVWDLVAGGHLDWRVVLELGGVDPIEVEHRELLALEVSHGVIVVVTHQPS